MGAALKIRSPSVPKQNGEVARLKVVQGPDQGITFILVGADTTIGRGEDNDIILSDLKASRRHARIVYNTNQWWVKDLASSNGILLNRQTTRDSKIKSGDLLGFGSTMVEFQSAETPTQMLMAPSQRGQTRIMSAPQPQTHNRIMGAELKSTQKTPSPLILIVAVVVGLYLYFDQTSKNKTPLREIASSSVIETGVRDLASYLPEASSGEINKTADIFFKAAFRDFREGNYIRAKTQFETVLQMAPNHHLAQLYLGNCNKEIQDQVKAYLDRGRRSYDSGKFKDSKHSYESVLRLLYRDPASPSFLEAKDNLEKLKAVKRGDS